jgi:hypothetical protein
MWGFNQDKQQQVPKLRQSWCRMSHARAKKIAFGQIWERVFSADVSALRCVHRFHLPQGGRGHELVLVTPIPIFAR